MTFQELFEIDIIKLLGLENAPEEERSDFQKEVAGAVLYKVVERIEKELPEEKRKEFFRLFAHESANEERVRFITDHIPDLEEYILEEVMLFRKGAAEAAGLLKPE